MRSGSVAMLMATSAACVPTVEPSREVAGSYYLVVEITDDAPGELRAWGAGRERFVRAFTPGAVVYYLGYSRPLTEVGIDVQPDLSVRLVRADPTSDASLPLAPPTHWSKVRTRCDEGADPCVAEGRDELPPELMGVRVLRPDCPDIVLEPIRFEGPQAIVSITPFGPQGVLLGRSQECALRDANNVCVRVLPAAIIHVDPRVSATTGDLLRGPTATSTPTLDPLFFEEAGQLRVIWGSTVAYAFAVAGDLTFRDPEPIRAGSGDLLYPIAIASRTFAAGTTTLMVDYGRRLWARETPSGPFALLGSAESSLAEEEQCDSGTNSSLLAVTRERQGLVSFRRDPIRSVNLGDDPAIGAVYGPGGRAEACRSARAVMDSGDELLAWRGVASGLMTRAELWWRRSDADGWERLRSGALDPVGSGVVAQGDSIFAAVQKFGDPFSSIAVFQRDPDRPELVPRHCGNYETPLVIRVMASTPYGAVAGGLDTPPMWIRAVPRDAR